MSGSNGHIPVGGIRIQGRRPQTTQPVSRRWTAWRYAAVVTLTLLIHLANLADDLICLARDGKVRPR